MSWNILVSDPLSAEALATLREQPDVTCEVLTGKSPDELAEVLPRFDGWIIRSGTRVTPTLLEAASRMKAIARAGVGVDNVDLDAATRAGVLVMNTPFGNTVSAAEQTIALMFALSRKLPAACASLREGRWERKKFVGTELTGKVLGVVGLGKIGRAVAERAAGLKMRVLGYDPFVTSDRDEPFRLAGLAELFAKADIVTVHVPINERTRHLIGAEALRAMRPGTLVLNCARGGVVDEQALLAALEEGHIGGAGLDVFETEPPTDRRLVAHPRVVATPHLGASTREAQVKVGQAAVAQILAFLRNGAVENAVNMPSLDASVGARLAPFVVLAEKIGRLQGQIAEGGISEVEVGFSGEVFGEEGRELCTRAVLQGLLGCFLDGPVNRISARSLAIERGLEVRVAESQSRDFAAVLEVSVAGAFGRRRVAGALFGQKFPRLIRIDGYRTDAIPEGPVLMLQNKDQPGMLARICNLIGEAGTNIANVTLARDTSGGTALALFNLDSPLSDETLSALRAIDAVHWVAACDLGK